MATVLLGACAPALDWREIKLGAADAMALFPCKPASHARELVLAGQRVTLTLYACQADEVTWGLAWADVVEPSQVAPALRALLDSTRLNLGQASLESRPFSPRGQTPNPASGRWSVQGRYPDGKAVTGQVAVFSRATVVFQATALGARPASDAADTYFDALKFGP